MTDKINRTEPEDIRITALYSCSTLEAGFDRAEAEKYALYSLRQQVASLLVDKKHEVSEHAFSKTYRLELYAATPDEFWRIVRHEAEMMANRYGQKLPTTGEPW